MTRLTITSLIAALACCAQVPVTDVEAPAHEYKFPNTVEVGSVDAETLGPAYARVLQLANSGEKLITLRIDSFGGEIHTGIKFLQMVEDVKKTHDLKIACIVHGSAYSMGAVILESSICDLRGATPTSTILFHNARSGVKGTAIDMHAEADFLEALNEAMGLVISRRIGMSYDDYRSRIHGRDWTMSVIGALEYHVIDGLVDPSDIAPAPLSEL